VQSIKAVVIDYGGVLAHHYCEPYQSQLANLLGVSVPICKSLISEKSEQGRLFRINQISMEDFWSRVAILAQCQKPLDFQLLQDLWAKTYKVDERILRLLKIIRSNQLKLCLFTNTDKERRAYMFDKYNLSDYFDFELYSCETGLIKSSMDAIVNLIAVCGVQPKDILFIDDREQAVNHAKSLGLSGYVYRSFEDLSSYFISCDITKPQDSL
jgi:putative hydrolase of the HAD superfamily